MPGKLWRHFDFSLLGATMLSMIFGVVMISSAIAGNQTLINENLVPRQIIYGAIGLAVLFVTAAIDYRFWSAVSRPIYLFTCLSLGAVAIAGLSSFGASRWLDAGIVIIQPSELAKILLIIVLAAFLARYQERLKQFRWVALSLVYVGVPVGFIFIQPDLSTALMLIVVWFAMVWAAGLRWTHLATFAMGGFAAPVLLWPFLRNYQRARIIQFIFPSGNPDAQYNVDQSLISIGSGGLWGQGYRHCPQVQLRFLKVRHTDFIFSATACEFGMAGALIVILLLGFIVWRCLRAARLARDPFGALICYGVATLIFYHAAFHVGMKLNLLPVAGLPLPFISYGGSSLLTKLLGIGLVESVVLRQKQIEF